ncbi:MAG: preprotein translocase subunit SecE [Phycisphaerae bacterium]|nr:preprotein translocase subunit SecE [Tepidisphaeraceae bacterium]
MADDESPKDIERAKAPGPDAADREAVPARRGGGGGVTVVPARRTGGGFFSIYKRGQGYWTRMGTLFAAVLIGFLTAEFLYVQIYSRFNSGKNLAAGIALGFFVLFELFAWRLMNKPGNVDFLIATDSEMKKVNWTSRRELIGSTKVVVFFVILISALLFVLDIVFGSLFQLIGVLESGPFG